MLPLFFSTLQVRMHHAALNGAWTHDGNLHHQVVETPGLQARQHAHLGAAFNLKDPDGVGCTDHVVGVWSSGMSCKPNGRCWIWLMKAIDRFRR